MASSFQKKSKPKLLNISGTKQSLHNNQLLVSTGVPALDNIIGGGIAVGTVLLIEEDVHGSYSSLLLKYQLAETIVCGHSLFLAVADPSPSVLLRSLPGEVRDEPKDSVPPSGAATNEEVMKIAWRYQSMPQVQTTPKGDNKFGHYYDLTKTMETERVQSTPQTLVDVMELNQGCECGKESIMKKSYERVLDAIRKKIEEGKFSTSVPNQQRSILRICLSSLGSPLWGEEGGGGGGSGGGLAYDPSLCRFLYALRALVRSAFATCVITMPSHLLQDSGLVRRVEHLCDTVIRLESFAGSDREMNPAYKEYHGLMHVVKLPRVNSLKCDVPETLEYAFKLRRKKFTIEKLHLPPDLSETASRGDQEDLVKNLYKTASTPCGVGAETGKLDF